MKLKIRLINEGKMILFTAVLGAVAGSVIWWYLKAVSVCTSLLWEKLPAAIHFAAFPVIMCAAGGLLIGLVHKYLGDYPEELPVVMGKIKQQKHYDYKPMAVMLVASFLPLVFGGSIGPEAGMTGVIAGLCCWVGDNVKYAKERQQEYSEIGEAVTLGVIFHAPLFGVFAVEEENLNADTSKILLPKPMKFVLYGIAIGAAMLVFRIFGNAFGHAGGIPRFSDVVMSWQDYVMLLVYIPAGTLLFAFFCLCEKCTGFVAGKLPLIVREIAGGILIGVIGMLLPVVLFSGEEQLAEMTGAFFRFTPWILIGVCLLKVFLTTFSIHFGFKGGHFFPVIFAAACLGFGIAMAVFPAHTADHVVFAAGVVMAATFGAQIKKPLAVTMLTLLCFPVKMIPFLFFAAVVGKWLACLFEKQSMDSKSGTALP